MKKIWNDKIANENFSDNVDALTTSGIVLFVIGLSMSAWFVLVGLTV